MIFYYNMCMEWKQVVDFFENLKVICCLCKQQKQFLGKKNFKNNNNK